MPAFSNAVASTRRRRNGMWLCTDWKIDWNAISAVATAVAAIFAVCVWYRDNQQRKRERSASAKLLAQIMKTPIGATRVEVARFRCDNFSAVQIKRLLIDENARKTLGEKVSSITIDLPSQFLDKADIFSEKINNELASAFFHVNNLKQIVMMTADLPNSAKDEDISKHVGSVIQKIQQSEDATQNALNALQELGSTGPKKGITLPFALCLHGITRLNIHLVELYRRIYQARRQKQN
ncbi:hypothetical protein ACK3BK_12245 [Pseudomonas sp. L7]|uniref:hypothetical protein n=2 Tax=unclassified Pseudomonas TaxID=196821 RepID=UPI003985483B